MYASNVELWGFLSVRCFPASTSTSVSSVNIALSVARLSGIKTTPISCAQIYQTDSRNFLRRTKFEKYEGVAPGFGSRYYSLNIILSLYRNPVPYRCRCPCFTGLDVRISGHACFLRWTPGGRAAKQPSEKRSPSPRSNGDSKFGRAPPKESQYTDS